MGLRRLGMMPTAHETAHARPNPQRPPHPAPIAPTKKKWLRGWLYGEGHGVWCRLIAGIVSQAELGLNTIRVNGTGCAGVRWVWE